MFARLGVQLDSIRITGNASNVLMAAANVSLLMIVISVHPDYYCKMKPLVSRPALLDITKTPHKNALNATAHA